MTLRVWPPGWLKSLPRVRHRPRRYSRGSWSKTRRPLRRTNTDPAAAPAPTYNRTSRTRETRASLLGLPLELQYEILCYLCLGDMHSLCNTCRFYRQIMTAARIVLGIRLQLENALCTTWYLRPFEPCWGCLCLLNAIDEGTENGTVKFVEAANLRYEIEEWEGVKRPKVKCGVCDFWKPEKAIWAEDENVFKVILPKKRPLWERAVGCIINRIILCHGTL